MLQKFSFVNFYCIVEHPETSEQLVKILFFPVMLVRMVEMFLPLFKESVMQCSFMNVPTSNFVQRARESLSPYRLEK